MGKEPTEGVIMRHKSTLLAIWTLGLCGAALLVDRSVAESKPQQAKLQSKLVKHFPKTVDLLNGLSINAPDAYKVLLARAESLISPEADQNLALVFARKHHPELAKLIDQLKMRTNKRSYNAAIKSLMNDMKKLDRLKARDPKTYPMELDNWKLQSKIRLVSARMARSDDPGHEQALVSLLGQQASVKQKIYKNSKQRLQGQLNRLDVRLNEDAAAFVKRELNRIKKGLSSKKKPPSQKKPKSPKPPAA